MRLDGKVAVITGAGSGMGRAMAEIFAREGAKVVGGEMNAATLEEIVAEVRAKNGEMTGKKTDVSNRESAEGLIDFTKETYGRVDVLVNCAGIMDFNHGVGNMPDDVWERVIGVNLNGPMYTSRRAVQYMLESGGGSIINISSISGMIGAAAGAAYTVSKHGLVGLTRNTAWIYAQKSIRCNVICPGATRSNILTSFDESRADAEGSKRTSLHHSLIPAVLETSDIANMALFLASDEARMINGALIPADGGWTTA